METRLTWSNRKLASGCSRDEYEMTKDGVLPEDMEANATVLGWRLSLLG